MAARKTTKTAVKYVATAPFEHEGKTYQPGDEFAVPDNWELDEAYMAAFARDLGSKPAFSTAEVYDGPNEKRLIKPAHRYIMPLKADA